MTKQTEQGTSNKLLKTIVSMMEKPVKSKTSFKSCYYRRKLTHGLWMTGLLLTLLLAGCAKQAQEQLNNDDQETQAGQQGDQQIQATGYTISGHITAYEQNTVDSDVNDPNAPYAANGPNLSDAQDIPNPITLGGYVNLPGQGAPGRSQQDGDLTDIYRVTMLAGQTIRLHLAGHPDNHDLDLYLYDSNGSLVDASADVGAMEWLTVTDPGDYYIVVEAFSGVETTASNYVLTIGMGGANPAASNLRLSDTFMPGDLHVKLTAQTVANKGGQSATTYMSKALGAKHKAGKPQRSMLFQMDPDRPHAYAKAGALQSQPGIKATTITDAQKQKLNTLMALKALRRNKQWIEAAEPNYLLQAQAVPNDEYYSYQWHYPFINLPQTWDVTTGDANVIAAVIDTGVLLGFPDLQGQLVPGYDFISVTSISNDGDGIDNNPDDPGDGGGGKKSSFHGTHVAGTIAAASNNSDGVAGVAWNASIMPIRVLGVGGGTGYDVIQGVRYAAGMDNDSGTVPDKAADVINLSLGGGGYSGISQSVYTEAYNRGVMIIAAAGNSSTSQLHYPASYDNVVSVSAVNIRKGLSYYSNYGTRIDVGAPGGDMRADVNGDGYGDGVLSTVGDDSQGFIRYGYSFYQGTSMATPHMAGVAALMKSVNPNLTPGDLDQLLASGAVTEDLGHPGRDDQFGHGLIDAYKAVTEANNLAGGGPIPEPDPSLAVSPGSLNFGSSLTTLNLNVGNSGGGELTITTVTSDQTWLTITPDTTGANGLGTYTATVDREFLQVGTFGATITVESSAGTDTLPVMMQVTTNPTAGDAGTHYVLLLNADTLEPVAQAAVDAGNGFYSYNLTGVPEGNYLLVAGSDRNNDGYICDTNEACGGHPLVTDLQAITVSADQTIDFSSGFNFHITTLNAMTLENRTQQGWRRLR